jgi:hypothetical protein
MHGVWSTSHLGRFVPRERILGSHYIGGSVGLGSDLDQVANKDIFTPTENSIPVFQFVV